MTKMNKDEWMKVASAFYDGEDVEFRKSENLSWNKVDSSYLNICFFYRVKPVKPSIDWSHIGEQFNFMTMTHKSTLLIHINEPLLVENDHWYCVDSEELEDPSVFASFKKGSCHWIDSLVRRPAPCARCGGSGFVMLVVNKGESLVSENDLCPACCKIQPVE